MRDVGFDPERGGKMYTLKNLNLIESELIRRTAQIMPELVKRGIVSENQGAIVSKFIIYLTALEAYDPKLWHKDWAPKVRRIANVKNQMGWSRF
jgi:hypothetical protein